MHQLIKLIDAIWLSTAGNLFPSHSCIGWHKSSPHRYLNAGLQIERWMTYQLSYPSPLLLLLIATVGKKWCHHDRDALFCMLFWAGYSSFFMQLLMPKYCTDNQGMLNTDHSLKTLSMFWGMSFVDLWLVLLKLMQFNIDLYSMPVSCLSFEKSGT